MISDQALELIFNETIYFIEETDHKVTVIHDHKVNFDSSEEKELLWNILNAIQISKKETLVLTKDKSAKAADNSTSFFILFGITPPEIGFLNTPNGQYEVYEIENKKLVVAHSLKIIKGDNDKKKALWLSLKKMFSV